MKTGYAAIPEAFAIFVVVVEFGVICQKMSRAPSWRKFREAGFAETKLCPE